VTVGHRVCQCKTIPLSFALYDSQPVIYVILNRFGYANDMILVWKWLLTQVLWLSLLLPEELAREYHEIAIIASFFIHHNTSTLILWYMIQISHMNFGCYTTQSHCRDRDIILFDNSHHFFTQTVLMAAGSTTFVTIPICCESGFMHFSLMCCS
jgi:hypothetical protein